jgi:hypothetical protein
MLIMNLILFEESYIIIHIASKPRFKNEVIYLSKC